MLRDYLPAIVFLILGSLVGLLFGVLNLLVGRRRRNRSLEPYECGLPSEVQRGFRFGISFYLVAMLFIVFDIETVFMLPWGGYYRELSCSAPLVGGACPAGHISFFGLGEMVVFVAILLVGLVYVWKKGALQWD